MSMARLRTMVAVMSLSVMSCEHPSPDRTASPDTGTSRPHAIDAATRAPMPTPSEPGPAIDPGNFQRFGCATDPSPPHMVAGTASVVWRPVGGPAFNFQNLPARCGSAYPGQLIDGVRSRPGDGAEFVVCMPDERRLDVGILRRGPVAAGPQDVAHTPNLVRLRIALDRFVNIVDGDAGPNTRLTFGPHLHSAAGFMRLGASPTSPSAGTIEFGIDCGR